MKRFFLIATLVASIFSGCKLLPFNRDPFEGPFPYQFKDIREIPLEGLMVDFDGDGRDEFVMINNSQTTLSPPRLIFYNHDFATLRQKNFNGKVQRPFFFDWNGDGAREIWAPFVKDNTTFLRIMDRSGETLIQAPLFSGKSRVDSETYAWSGNIVKIAFEDLNNDGAKECIVFPSEAFAQRPRGIFVYEGNSLKLLWQHEIGPALSPPAIADVNNDGALEILIPTRAPENGNVINGTDDSHSYLFLFDGNGKILWRKDYGGIHSQVEARFLDVDADGSLEIIVLFTEQNDKPRLEILNSQTGQPFRTFKVQSNFANWQIVQTDSHTDKEVLIATDNGELLLMDSHLEIIRTARHPYPVAPSIIICEDLDNDGFDEILLDGAEGLLCLTPDLAIKAGTYRHPGNLFGNSHVYHRGSGTPLLVLFEKDLPGASQKAELVALQKNSRYIISYYGPPAALILGGTFLILFVAIIARSYRAKSYYARFFEKSANRDEPILVVNARMRITFANAAARELFELKKFKSPVPISELPQEREKYIELLSTLETCEPIRQEFDFMEEKDNGTIIRLIAETIKVGSVKKPHWLVIFENNAIETELERTKSWAAMAQRIAHDIKNPLSSIQLTLQRLQMEYRDRDKEGAKIYDHYVERIIERIEASKRMSRGFMKFLNLEKLTPQPTDVNKFVENLFTTSVIELPTDIKLEKKLATNLPTTHLDQEQLQTLLENLVSNAVNAMPDGGKLSITTDLASDLHFDRITETPADYITIEVMDIGLGISAEMQEKLFQPFTTKSHSGTGLGLTIVKKIVTDHKGHIEVTGEEGVGASFTIYLPVA